MSFLETLGRYRPESFVVNRTQGIEGDVDFFPLGVVPSEWCDERLLGSAFAVEWIALLCYRLAGECLRLGSRCIFGEWLANIREKSKGDARKIRPNFAKYLISVDTVCLSQNIEPAGLTGKIPISKSLASGANDSATPLGRGFMIGRLGCGWQGLISHRDVEKMLAMKV